MSIALAIVVGALYASALYLMLRRNIVKLIIGLSLLSHGANLLIFTAAGLVRGKPPIIPVHAEEPVTPIADPLPQALILTAIVISFGVLAFTLILLHRAHHELGTDDIDQMSD